MTLPGTLPGTALSLILLVLAGCSVPAGGEPAPTVSAEPAAAGPPGRAIALPTLRTRLATPRPDVPRLTDLATGRELIDGRLGVVVEEGPRSTPDIQIVPAEGGFDLLATFSNTTDRPQPLGTLRVPSIAMPRSATWYDFRRGSEPVRFDHGNRGFRRADHAYPSDLYSPVAVLADATHAIGASVLYDPRVARHSVNVVLRTKRPAKVDGPAQDRRWVWSILFELGGTIAPGQTRTYTVAVRAASASDWIRTLEPYRDHFHQTFGTIAYEADPRPVRGHFIAGAHAQRPENPRGFLFANRRPDVHGFAPWARIIAADAEQMGVERVMLWALSGLHADGRNNYPPIFMTGLAETPRAEQSVSMLSSIAARGLSLGLWWGRSQEHLSSFADRQISRLDPNDPEHVAKALAELDAAVALGAREIGLDAFAYMPVWQAERWLKTLQARAPGVRFVLEPSPPDVLHRLAPAYTRGEVLTERHALADLLLPGHETWAQIRFDTLRKRLGRMTPDQMQLEAERIARLGFVPVLFEPIPRPDRATAALR